MKENEYLTIKEVQSIMKISRQTVYDWMEKGLKAYRIGRVVRIKKSDLIKFVEKNDL